MKIRTFILSCIFVVFLNLSYAFPFDFSIWDCPTQCHGDADCDGYVGMNDLLSFRAAEGSYYPDLYYNPAADFNRDFQVDNSDFDDVREDLYHHRIASDY